MTNMDKPLVSVLVPIFNVEEYLRQCVDSLLSQTLDDFEVILIDDGSTDGSAQIVDEYANADARIRTLHKPNSGYGDSMNRGLDLARGTWVAIVEPDDWAEDTMLEQLIDAARAHGAARHPVDIAKGSYWREIQGGGDGPCTVLSVHADLVKPAAQPFSIDECPQLLALHPSIWSAIYRRGFLDEFGIRFRPIPGAGWADNPFFVETMVAARAIAWTDEPVYHYREFEDGSLSHLEDWHVIRDRWHDMGEVLRRYDAEMPAIMAAHSCRGCAYLQMLSHDFNRGDAELQAAERELVESLDYDTVRRSPFIPAEYKRAYARFLPFARRLPLLFGA